jgi:beta-N-acetylhexosaminidase
LSGSIEERSTAALTVGCDIVLHCNGRIDEMRAVDLAELRKTFAALLAGGQTAGARMVLS